MPKVQLLAGLLIALVISSLALSGCSASNAPKSEILPMTVSLDDMPAEVKAAPAIVQQAYQFTAEHQDIAKRIPCYCGCGAMGHTSSFSCYIADVSPDRKITYDTHALGCSICVDITQDTSRLLDGGKSVEEIKAYIDQTYSQYGPANTP